MTSYKFGDIVLVPFPFTDQTTTKKRPAVVVSSDAYQKEKFDLILMAVTSQSKPRLAFGGCYVSVPMAGIRGLVSALMAEGGSQSIVHMKKR